MDKLLQMLSLARRAGKLALGFDAVGEAAQSGRAALILLSEQAAERTRRNILRIAEKRAPVLPVPYSPDDLSAVLGKAVAALAVTDPNFADGIRKLLPRNDPNQGASPNL